MGGDKDMPKEYFLGLDLGTGSLGWAVTDLQYNVLRAHGKSLWGVRLFDSAQTAKARRIHRGNRRRLHRKHWRLQLLQEIFASEIANVDPGFYLRMKESRYIPEDKRDLCGHTPILPYALFVDENYTDKDYHKEFPTIYHLRKKLMETKDTPDIRLVYLAIHHMLKNRGHFLLSGEIEDIKEFKSIYKQFIMNIQDEQLGFDFDMLEDDIIVFVENILKDKILTNQEKKKRLKKELEKRKGEKITKSEEEIVKLILGLSAKLSTIFNSSELEGSINFTKNTEETDELEARLGDRFYIIESAKCIYDWAKLTDILKDSNSISDAKIKIYNKHQEDLVYLKEIVKTYMGQEAYKNIFVYMDEKLDNYCAYIGMTKRNNKKVAMQTKKCSYDKFIAFLKKQKAKIKDEKIQEELQEKLNSGTFLAKQINVENSIIPHQLHLYELKQILNNLKKKIPLLEENSDKIIQLFTFRIPYYVGPLNKVKDEKSSPFTWSVRKKDDKIYPWNFEDVIDVEASAEQFIRRMTNKCTYLLGEDVLPKNSLLYSKFMILNGLNNLKINGDKIGVEIKQKIFKDVFCKYRRVTQKKLKKYLICEGILTEKDEISGIEEDFQASYIAYHDFKEKLTDVTLSEKEQENIILNITLFGSDQKLLKKRLKKLYVNLTEKQIDSLCKLSYKGWGRLSAKFLEGIITISPSTGEQWNIMTALWESQDNLMQLLSQKYKFQEEIEKQNHQEEMQLSYETIDHLAISPAVKRPIWQTLLVVKELQKVMKGAPKRIFLEVAREKQESKKTKSRKKQLEDLYKKCKEEADLLEDLKNKDDYQLRNDKLYFYYVQKGRCMYSKEVIPFEELYSNKYDIDHIYPQSKVIDDSLDNRVLVKKVENGSKMDEYPINGEIRQKMQPFWKHLFDGGFISKQKYERLVRSQPFDENELASFIERQIVETRQSTKVAAQILKCVFPETEIVYVKAKNVSQFRQDFNFIKVREINDFHHAKDAYLNIVVGNGYYVKFTKNAAWFIRNNPDRSYHLKKLFKSKDIVRDGEVAWKTEKSDYPTIHVVHRFMNKNDILITHRTYEGKGELFDQNILKKGKGQLPIKGSDERLAGSEGIMKYGGYNSISGSYFMLVESEDKKGNKIRSIEYVPLYLKEQLERNDEMKLQYLEEQCGLKKPRILIHKIKMGTLFKIDGFKLIVTARTGNQLKFRGAIQLLLSFNETKLLKKIMKFLYRRKENKKLLITEKDGISDDKLIGLYDTFLDKLSTTLYKTFLSEQEETLSKGRDLFIKLTKEDKCFVLSEILHLFQCNASKANLTLINGKGNAGIIKMTKNISSSKQILIIYQSPTGIYEKEIDLSKL